MKTTSLAVLLVAVASACATVVPHPLPFHAEHSGVPLEELEQGRTLFVSHCGSCHQAPLPGTRDAADWAKVLPDMVDDAHLDAHQAAQVLTFLQALSAGVVVPDAQVAQGDGASAKSVQ